MAKSTRITLQAQDIERLADAETFEKGRHLFAAGQVEGARLRAGVLSATVEGEEGERHEVRARLSADGVEDARCDCRYGGTGVCSHFVALLFTLTSRDAIPKADASPKTKKTTAAARKVVSLEDRLRERPAPELVELVLHLAARDSKLKAQIEIWLRGGLAEKDLKAITQQVRQQLKRYATVRRFTIAQLLKELKVHLKKGAELEANAPTQAVQIFAAVLEPLVTEPDTHYYWDRTGRLSEFTREVCGHVLRLLPLVPAEGRGALHVTLAHAFLCDVRLHGLDLCPGVEEALLALPVASYDPIEDMVDLALKPYLTQKQTVRSQNFGEPDDEHERLAAFKAQRLQKLGLEQEADELLLREGTFVQRVETLCRRHQFREAMELAKKSYSKKSLRAADLADRLETAAEWPLAKEWARYAQLLPWLADALQRHGDAEALAVNLELFNLHPTVQLWVTIGELLPEEKRNQVRRDMWSRLEKDGSAVVMMEVLLTDREYDQAERLLERITPWHRPAFTLMVARSALNSQPELALRVLRNQCEYLLQEGTNPQYSLHIQLLSFLKEVSFALGEQAQWTAYIGRTAQLRRRSHAFISGLKAAGLLPPSEEKPPVQLSLN